MVLKKGTNGEFAGNVCSLNCSDVKILGKSLKVKQSFPPLSDVTPELFISWASPHS